MTSLHWRRRPPFPLEEAKRLYIDEKLSLSQVGKALGYSMPGGQRRLRNAGVTLRKQGGANRWRNHKKPEKAPPKAKALSRLAEDAMSYRHTNNNEGLTTAERMERIAEGLGWKFTYHISARK